MESVCRVCLTTSSCTILYDLSSNVDDEELPGENRILDILETVVAARVLYNTTLPSSICAMCKSLMKIAYKFKKQFEHNQQLLSEYFDKTPVYNPAAAEIQSSPTKNLAPVEVIVGNIKYDLNEIIVVEEEPKSDCDFKGFLNNLGTAVTASFVNNNSKKDLETVTFQIDKMSDDLPNLNNFEVIFEENVANFSVDLFNNLEIYEEQTNDEDNYLESPVIVKTPPKSRVIKKRVKVVKAREKVSRIRSKIIRKVSKKMESAKVVELSDELFEKQLLFPCDICKRVFETEKKLKRHKYCIHSGKSYQEFTCNLCGYVSKTHSGARHHKLTHYEKQFICELCCKSYYTRSTLKVHMESHKNQRKHLCNICGKGFNYANALEYHLRVHRGEKKFQCSHCDARFTMPCGLKRHLRTHTGDRPYHCQYCDRAFSSSGEVQTHETVHTGFKPYHCKYCEKGFTKTHNLKMHLFSHYGPHKCDSCAKSFLEIDILAMHYKIVHKENC